MEPNPGVGNMDQHIDSRGEHRSVDDDAVPAVEAEMSHLVVTCVQCGQVVPEATDEEVAAFRASIEPAPETVEASQPATVLWCYSCEHTHPMYSGGCDDKCACRADPDAGYGPLPETVESLDRAVEEARRALLNSFEFDGNTFYGAVVAFEAAVSAKARAEERERQRPLREAAEEYRDAIAYWRVDRKERTFPGAALIRYLDASASMEGERARSSEEAGG